MDFLKRGETFIVDTKGKSHEIKFVRGRTSYTLYVDDCERETFKSSDFITMTLGDLNDYKFQLDGEDVVVAMRFGRAKIAVNGIYTETGKEYRDVLPFPVWGSIFVAAALAPPLILQGSFWDIIIAGCFAYVCSHYILKNPDLKAQTPLRIIYCILVIILSWTLFGLFMWLDGRLPF